MIPGLVSVTFRSLSPLAICRLCTETGLRAIEWGGDIHVPATGQNAKEVRQMSADANLTICSYGSYFRVGQNLEELKKVLAAAQELETPLVRIWCGSASSASLTQKARAKVIDQLFTACEEAKKQNLTLALEFHGGTLTDSLPSVEKLLQETASFSNLRFYWQPRWDWTQEENLLSLQMVLPRFAHAHVFTWQHESNGSITRLPFSAGSAFWQKALPLLDGQFSLMEFVKEDDPEIFRKDARSLQELMKNH